MKIIDILNKRANGEEVPKKIKYGDIIWTYENHTYIRKDLSPNYNDSNIKYLLGFYNFYILNDEVEIIEEDKKIEKFKTKCTCSELDFQLIEKINEIIDKLNEVQDDKN